MEKIPRFKVQSTRIKYGTEKENSLKSAKTTPMLFRNISEQYQTFGKAASSKRATKLDKKTVIQSC